MSVRLRSWFRAGPITAALPEVADGDLVCRFADTRDDGAFAELLRRHGPMVLATCRRILHPDVHTADDAFQAAFLVLATRAAAVSPPERVGAWLHGVAVHVARRARAWTRKLVPMAPADADRVPSAAPEVDPDAADVRAQIDDVLAGLPARYRAAVVLCDLEQRSRKEAAAGLGWSEGTLSSRLARARKLLADRLARRGVTVPAAGLGVLLPASGTTATVPAQLAASATRTATGATAGAAIPASVAALARDIPTHSARFKLLAAAAVVCLALGGVALSALTPADPPAPRLTHDLIAAPVPRAPVRAWSHRHTFTHEAPLTAVALAGSRVAAGDEAGRLLLWGAKGGGKELLCETATLVGAGEPAAVYVLQFAPDGKAVYFSLDDGVSVNVCTLDGDGKKGRVFPGTVQIAAVDIQALSRDGKHWLETNHEFNPDRAEVLVESNLLDKFDEELVGKPEAAFHHDGLVGRAAIGGADVVVTISETGVLRRWKKGREKPLWEERLVGAGEKIRPIDTVLAVCPRDKLVAAGHGNGEVRLYAADTGEVVATLAGHAGVVRAVAFGAGGDHLVTGGDDRTARVWDARTGKQLAVLEGHTGAVTAAAFAPDGCTIVTGGADKTVRVWEYRPVNPAGGGQ
jgi:RNA polymerase sigma factor (sigma-70 family)